MAGVRFWREFDTRYRMLASRCPQCGLVYFPPRTVCRKCRRSSLGRMEKVPLPPRASVMSYTVVHQGQKGFEPQVPYVMAVVGFEGGATVLGQIVDCDPEDVAIDMEVRAVFRRVREEGDSGVIHYGYKFAPLRRPGPSPSQGGTAGDGEG